MDYKKTHTKIIQWIWEEILVQNEKFNKAVNIKKEPVEILELKNTINEMKRSAESINVRIDQAEEKL